MANSSKDDSAADGDTSGGGTPSNSSVYGEGEKVLAYHGPRIYEAKASMRFSFWLRKDSDLQVLCCMELAARL